LNSTGVEFNQHDVVVVVGAVGGEHADQPLDRGSTASVSAAAFDVAALNPYLTTAQAVESII
jgi:hypothetical protein